MHFTLTAALLAIGLCGAMLAFLELGHRIGLRRLRSGEDSPKTGTGVVEGAVFALLGLLVAFTFSGAYGRFDERRQLIVEEANTIGSAYLLIDLLPAAAQKATRERFRDYVDARLEVYRAIPDLESVAADLARATALQAEIWTHAVADSAASQPATMLLLPALNGMFDITTTRLMAVSSHPPPVLFGLLFGLALLGALLAGNAMADARSRQWLHSTIFAFTLAGAVYVTLDMEYPRLGLIRVDGFDQVLVELRRSMN